MKQPFSKKLLYLDYLIMGILILGYFICLVINSLYADNFLKLTISSGYDLSSIVVPTLINMDSYVTFMTAWIAQVGVSSAAYYVMTRSDHKIELPMRMINTLPDDIKEQVDMNELITAVLQNTEN
ncbi:MAG: hypothetical protein MSH33_05015 [Fusobacterium necrophorum]|nr:hypothetical protein [Fusobacterium necrophorum]